MPSILLRLLILSLGFFSVTVVQAQDKKPDVIVTFDNQKLEVVVVEVGDEKVKYKKLDRPDGPLYTIAKSSVASILYGTGEVETFSKAADLYFEQKKTDNNEIPYIVEPPRTGTAADRRLHAQSSEKLRANHALYLRKSSTYRKMAIIGSSVGLLFIGVGSIMISEANRSSNYYGSVYDDRIAGGVLLITAGLGAGVPLTIVGFSKNKSYSKRALKVQEELRRRNQPLSYLRLKPAIDPLRKSGQLTLSMTF